MVSMISVLPTCGHMAKRKQPCLSETQSPHREMESTVSSTSAGWLEKLSRAAKLDLTSVEQQAAFHTEMLLHPPAHAWQTNQKAINRHVSVLINGLNMTWLPAQASCQGSGQGLFPAGVC